MRTAGYFLLILGAGSFLLPLVGWHPMIMSSFGRYEKHAAISAIVLGALLFGLSFLKKKKKEEKT
jgi:hypothetical protein